MAGFGIRGDERRRRGEESRRRNRERGFDEEYIRKARTELKGATPDAIRRYYERAG